MTERRLGRRGLLRAAGVGATAPLAGCVLGDGGDDGDGSESADDGSGDADNTRDADGTDDEDSDDGGEDASGQPLDADAVVPYRQFQYDAGNTGAATDRTLGDDPVERWRFERATRGPGYHIGSPAVAHGSVYVAETSDDESEEPTLYALAPTDASVQWSRTVAPTGGAPPIAATDDLVLVQGARLRALDPDGEDLWRTSDEYEFSREVAVAHDRAYGVSTTLSGNTLVAVSLADGSAAWEASVPQGRYPPKVAAGPDAVYASGSDLHAFDRDGTERWSAGLDHSVAGAPTVGDDRIFAVGSDDAVSAVDLDGEVLWQTTVDGSQFAQGSGPIADSPAFDGERLYVSNSGQITALDPDDGTELWTTDTTFADPPVVGADAVLVPGLNELHCLDPATGEHRWTAATDADHGSRNPPALLDGAVLYPSDGLHAVDT